MQQSEGDTEVEKTQQSGERHTGGEAGSRGRREREDTEVEKPPGDTGEDEKGPAPLVFCLFTSIFIARFFTVICSMKKKKI